MPGQRSLWVRILGILLLLAAQHSFGNPVGRSCPHGEYYIRALGGYVLLPAQYMPYALELEPGITGSYAGPSPPMTRRCTYEEVALAGGSIHTGTVEAIAKAVKLPKDPPTAKDRVGEFEVTIWSVSAPSSAVPQWWTVLITRNDDAMRIFTADPKLWRRIVDSYVE